jgi:hypothetical protein
MREDVHCGGAVMESGVIHEIVLRVTQADHDRIARRKNHRLLGDEMRGQGAGEIDLGDLDATEPLSHLRLTVPESHSLQIYTRDARRNKILFDLHGPLDVSMVPVDRRKIE